MAGKIRGGPGSGLFGATLGFFVGFAGVVLFGPTAARFKGVMHLTPIMVGFLVAMPSLSGSLLRIPFSAWVDTTGGRKPFLVLLGLSVIGMLGLFGVVHSLYPARLTIGLYPLLLFLGLLCGCGIATFSVGISQVAYWYPQNKQGYALGTYAGVGNLAPGLFSFVLPYALKDWGLGGSYLAWLVFLVVGSALYFGTGRNAWFFQLRAQGMDAGTARVEAEGHGQEIFPAGSTIESLKGSARVWRTWALVGLYFTTFGGFLAMIAWLPTYWKELFGVVPETAGLLTATYGILASVIRVFGGGLSDRLGGERTAILSLLTTAVGALVLTVTHRFGVAVAGEILMALGMGVANAAVFKLVPAYVPESVGGAAGWVGGLGAFGGFAVPPVLGIFVKVYGKVGYARGFVTFIVLAVVSLVLAFVLKAHRRAPQRAAPSTL